MKRPFVLAVFFTSLAVRSFAQQPVISAVVNAASYDTSDPPGSWVAITGSSLAGTTATVTGPATTELAGTSVSVNGLKAELLYVSATQVNALIPPDLRIPANTVVALTVKSAVGDSLSYPVRLIRSAPALFTKDGSEAGERCCSTGILRRWMPSRQARLLAFLLPDLAPPRPVARLSGKILLFSSATARRRLYLRASMGSTGSTVSTPSRRFLQQTESTYNREDGKVTFSRRVSRMARMSPMSAPLLRCIH